MTTDQVANVDDTRSPDAVLLTADDVAALNAAIDDDITNVRPNRTAVTLHDILSGARV